MKSRLHDAFSLRWRTLILLLLTSLLCPMRSHASVLAGPVTNQVNGHLYYLLTPSSWTDAEAEAVALGGHLATINDEQENQWIAELFGEVGDVSRALWIGLRDADNQGVYTWVSGEPLDFQFWWPGEPTDPTGQWNYVYITWPSVTRFGRWRPWENSEHRQGLPISGVVEVIPPPANSRIEIFPAVEIAWSSATNFAYQVQWTASLGSTNWFNLGSPVPGTGEIISLFDRAHGRPRRFYRVLTLPQGGTP